MTADGWQSGRLPPARTGLAGWLRVAVRGGAVGAVTYGGLVLLLLVRLAEAPLCGTNRPVSPYITQGVCRLSLRLMGLGLIQRGTPMRVPGVIVANHASWLDIFALNAADRVYFVSKSEVAGWPGIGWLARATGTVFITRRGAEAKRQQRLFEERLRAGHRLLFFPEGTSTDSRRILPFKSTLFAALYTHGLEHSMSVQPVTVVYHPPEDEDARFYGWWADMDFAGHLARVLAAPRQGRVEVIFHDPIAAEAAGDRKALAAWAESAVRAAHPDG